MAEPEEEFDSDEEGPLKEEKDRFEFSDPVPPEPKETKTDQEIEEQIRTPIDPTKVDFTNLPFRYKALRSYPSETRLNQQIEKMRSLAHLPEPRSDYWSGRHWTRMQVARTGPVNWAQNCNPRVKEAHSRRYYQFLERAVIRLASRISNVADIEQTGELTRQFSFEMGSVADLAYIALFVKERPDLQELAIRRLQFTVASIFLDEPVSGWESRRWKIVDWASLKFGSRVGQSVDLYFEQGFILSLLLVCFLVFIVFVNSSMGARLLPALSRSQ